MILIFLFFLYKGEGLKFASVDLKQQNLPIKIHKYKKTFSKIPQKEKRFIPSRSQSCCYPFNPKYFFRKKGFIPLPSPLTPKKSPLFRQSRGKPRLSLSSFALAVALLPPYSQSSALREGRDRAYTQSV